MTNPYKVDGPAVVSFSGGRTSARMLWEIILAHGGRLPPDVFAIFANTGKEREETDCAQRWSCPVVWLERPPGGGVREVTYETASRAGEPWEVRPAEGA